MLKEVLKITEQQMMTSLPLKKTGASHRFPERFNRLNLSLAGIKPMTIHAGIL